MTSDAELSNSPRIGISSTPGVQRVNPGEQTVFSITVENRTNEAQAQTVGVRGIPAEWCELDFDDRQRAVPGDHRSATLKVTVPATAEAGQRPFVVVARTGADESAVQCTLEVLGAPATQQAAPPPAEPVAAPAPGIELSQPEVTWDGDASTPARVTARVRNVGTEPTDYAITLEGLPEGWYTLPARLRIPGGEAAEAQVNIHPPARARAGDFAFTVRAAVEGDPRTGREAKASLKITPPAPPAPPRRPVAPPPTPVAEQTSAGSGAPVLPPDVSLAPRNAFRFGPGEVSAQALVTIANKSRLIERYLLKVEGIPEDWYSLSTEDLRLDPGASQQVPLRITPKTGAGMPAGEYTFRVRVAPHRFPDSFAEVGGQITIAGQAAFDARLVPAQAEGRKEKFKLTLANTGSVPISLWMEGTDSEGMLKFKFPPPPHLDPGEEAVVPVYVGARRNGALGQPESFDFRLKVGPAGGVSTQMRQFDARLTHRPFLSNRFAGIMVFLAALVALVGMAISIGSSRVESAFTWAGCQIDDDYQPVKGRPALTKSSCGGLPEATQQALLGLSPVASPQATAAPTQQGGGGGGDCATAASIASGGKVRAVSDAIRIRQEPGLSGAQVPGNPVLNNGDTASVLEGHRCADNIVWWRVRKDSGGQEGWVAEGQSGQLFLQAE
jgi:hypothetical protein